MIKPSRVMPVTIGLFGLGLLVLCIPLVVVAFQRLLILAVPFTVVLVWLAYVCVRLTLTRTTLRVDSQGLTVAGRGVDVAWAWAWAWDQLAAVGFVTCKGNEFLALRLLDKLGKPRLKFFLYPSWSDEVQAVVLRRVDYLPMSRREIQEAVRGHAGDRWKDAFPTP